MGKAGSQSHIYIPVFLILGAMLLASVLHPTATGEYLRKGGGPVAIQPGASSAIDTNEDNPPATCTGCIYDSKPLNCNPDEQVIIISTFDGCGKEGVGQCQQYGACSVEYKCQKSGGEVKGPFRRQGSCPKEEEKEYTTIVKKYERVFPYGQE